MFWISERSLLKPCLGSRFGGEMEGIWGDIGHPSKDLQADQEAASTGNISLVKSTMLHPGGPETLSWSDVGDW